MRTCVSVCLYIGVVSLCESHCAHVVCVTPCMFGGAPSPLLAHPCVQEVQAFQSTAQVEQLLLEHGERVVDCRLGTEIDRVEIKIMVPGVGRFQTATPTLSTHACTLSTEALP